MWIQGQILANKNTKELVIYAGFGKLRKKSFGLKKGQFAVLFMKEGGKLISGNAKDFSHLIVLVPDKIPSDVNIYKNSPLWNMPDIVMGAFFESEIEMLNCNFKLIKKLLDENIIGLGDK